MPGVGGLGEAVVEGWRNNIGKIKEVSEEHSKR